MGSNLGSPLTTQSDPDIIIVEGLVIKRGDTVILNTNESLSLEVLTNIRGRLNKEFEDLGVNFYIVAGANLIHIPKEESQGAYFDTNNA